MRQNFVIAVHGGAQNRNRSEIGIDLELEYRSGLDHALISGWELLEQGGSALDAVESAVRSLEDNPLFNAGKGSALTRDGLVEMDAAIMSGKTLKAGAVAAVKGIKNPVSLARVIMENENYTFMSGEGAVKIAEKYHLEIMPEDYFLTQEKIESLQQEKEKAIHDTVGAVALDREGNLASATSTGGLTNKPSGRIGDSPVIGAGTYANNEYCAVSCTGDGDIMIRGLYAYNVFALMKFKNLSLKGAVRKTFIQNNKILKAEMGIIAVDYAARVQLTSNTLPMFRAMKRNYEKSFVGVWEE